MRKATVTPTTVSDTRAGGVVVALDAGHVTGNEHDAGEDAGHAAGRGPVEEHAKPDPAHTGGSQHQDDAHPVGQQGLQEQHSHPQDGTDEHPTKRESPTWRVCSRELCMHTMQAMQE